MSGTDRKEAGLVCGSFSRKGVVAYVGRNHNIKDLKDRESFPTRKIDVRLLEKKNSNSYGARPVHLIITRADLIGGFRPDRPARRKPRGDSREDAPPPAQFLQNSMPFMLCCLLRCIRCRNATGERRSGGGGLPPAATSTNMTNVLVLVCLNRVVICAIL